MQAEPAVAVVRAVATAVAVEPATPLGGGPAQPSRTPNKALTALVCQVPFFAFAGPGDMSALSLQGTGGRCDNLLFHGFLAIVYFSVEQLNKAGVATKISADPWFAL